MNKICHKHCSAFCWLCNAGYGYSTRFLALRKRGSVGVCVGMNMNMCVCVLKDTPNIGAVSGKRGASTMVQVLPDILGDK